MNLFINDTKQMFEPNNNETTAEFINRLKETCINDGVIISDLFLDQINYAEMTDMKILNAPVDEIKTIKATAMPAMQAASIITEEQGIFIKTLLSFFKNAAKLIRTNDLQNGYLLLIKGLEGMFSVFNKNELVFKCLKIQKDQYVIKKTKYNDLVNVITQQISEMKKYITSGDGVNLADTIEYEFIDKVKMFALINKEMEKKIFKINEDLQKNAN